MTYKVVEINESKFFHRKYHRGQWRAGHWVFGGIERYTKKCFLVEVPDRTAETLSNLIQRYVYQKLAMRFNNNVVIKTHCYFFFNFFYLYKLY
jgi:hypothetical protein